MLHLLQGAVSPIVDLEKSIRSWYSISCRLREPPRRRDLKMEEMEAKGASLS
jgi:hypothetical protein